MISLQFQQYPGGFNILCRKKTPRKPITSVNDPFPPTTLTHRDLLLGYVSLVIEFDNIAGLLMERKVFKDQVSFALEYESEQSKDELGKDFQG